MKLSEDKRFWLIKRRLQGASVVFLCREADISRRTFYYYWNRFQRESWRGLGPKSHRPKTVHRTPQETVDLVLKLRETYGWGPARIEGYLKQENTEGVKPVGHNAVYRIIKRAGLNSPLETPRKTWGKKRFQRTEPNQMWHSKLLGSLRAQTALPSVANRLETYPRRQMDDYLHRRL